MSRLHSVLILGFPDCQLLDVTGTYEVFAQVNDKLELADQPAFYDVELRGTADHGRLRSSSGLELLSAGDFRDRTAPVDTLMLVGGAGTAEAMVDEDLISWIADRAPSCQRVVSVCSGTFLLAEAGLLDGRAATTHWSGAELLKIAYPEIRVEPDRIYVEDGPIWSSAGVTAGIDLSLALVERDISPSMALSVARELVVFMKRPGGQAQFSAQLSTQWAEREPLRDLQAYIVEHPDRDHRIAELAKRAGMSPRNFARRFTEQVGVTPSRFVERARVESARSKLERSDRGVAEVAAATGFGSSESMRRAFIRALGVAPSDYRSRFRATA